MQGTWEKKNFIKHVKVIILEIARWLSLYLKENYHSLRKVLVSFKRQATCSH